MNMAHGSWFNSACAHSGFFLLVEGCLKQESVVKICVGGISEFLSHERFLFVQLISVEDGKITQTKLCTVRKRLMMTLTRVLESGCSPNIQVFVSQQTFRKKHSETSQTEWKMCVCLCDVVLICQSAHALVLLFEEN